MDGVIEIEEALDGLIETILDSKIYRDYKAASSELDMEPGLREKVNEFRKRNYELQNGNMDDSRFASEVDKFEEEFDAFRANPRVHRFLAAELAFVKVMRNIYNGLTNGLDFD